MVGGGRWVVAGRCWVVVGGERWAWRVGGGGEWWVVGGGWWVVAGGWWVVGGGWWLAGAGWWWVVGGG